MNRYEAIKSKQYKARVAQLGGPLTVSADDLRETVQRWLTAGFSPNVIALAAGLGGTTIDRIADGRTRRIEMHTAAVIAGLTPALMCRAAPDRHHVPAIGAVRRVRAAQVIGHPARAFGVSPATRSELLTAKFRTLEAATHRMVASRYRELVLRPGDNVRAHRRAEREGWHGPMAWDGDSIDDPYAEPETDEEHLDRSLEVVRTAEEGLLLGLSPDRIAADLSLKTQSLFDLLRRYGRGDLSSRLRAAMAA